MAESPTETSVHRALADERRARIVEELQANPDGLDAQELAKRLRLHANTIRWHLAVLADAGLVDSHPGERTTPGRPRIVFTTAHGGSEGESYRLLATILTGGLAELPDAGPRAEEAGRAWGRYLVDRPPPHVPTTDPSAVRQIVALLDEHGFRPEADGHEIRMHRCPFRELAETAPGVVCAVHSGLISGALAELHSRLEVQQLDSFVKPDLCIARLRVQARRIGNEDAMP
jgi:predicted ArsR family transcriptional regulator